MTLEGVLILTPSFVQTARGDFDSPLSFENIPFCSYEDESYVQFVSENSAMGPAAGKTAALPLLPIAAVSCVVGASVAAFVAAVADTDVFIAATGAAGVTGVAIGAAGSGVTGISSGAAFNNGVLGFSVAVACGAVVTYIFFSHKRY